MKRNMVLSLSVLLIMLMTTGAFAGWMDFWIIDEYSFVNPSFQSGEWRIQHGGSHQTTRFVEEVGIRWWYLKDLQIIDDPYGWSQDERTFSPGGYINAISRTYTYTPETVTGTHQTSIQHWAQDYNFSGVPVTKWESTNDTSSFGLNERGDLVVTNAIPESLHNLRQSMISNAAKTSDLDGWNEYDIYYNWDTKGPFDWGIGATLLKVLEPGDYWPVVFTKGNEVAFYVVKGDDSELLVTVEDVERFMTADDVLFISVTRK